jgi:ATP-dependent RNA helicase RhlE
LSSFADLGVSAPVCRALERSGMNLPFEIQSLVMADALAGRDVLAKSETGSGKTLAFAIPIVERLDPSDHRPKALVLVPTRELAEQVSEEFSAIARARGLKVASVYGGVALREQATRAAKAQIVIATPGRLEDLVGRRLIDLRAIEILVLDEADRMLDMGFRPQVDSLVRYLEKRRQTMFFSATLDGQVGYLARAYTKDAATHSIEEEKQTVAEADHRFIPVKEHGKIDKLVELLTGERRGLALVFVRTKRGADRLAHKLAARGIQVVALHGDMTQAMRTRALHRFDTGKVDVLIATDVASRGLDLDGITHVVNYDPPSDFKGYVHRVGRTARAGRAGTGVTLVLPEQQADVGIMASQLKLKEEFESEGLKMAAPRLVFSSRRGRSSMRSRPRRRF